MILCGTPRCRLLRGVMHPLDPTVVYGPRESLLLVPVLGLVPRRFVKERRRTQEHGIDKNVG